jgi:hypothetical protein
MVSGSVESLPTSCSAVLRFRSSDMYSPREVLLVRTFKFWLDGIVRIMSIDQLIELYTNSQKLRRRRTLLEPFSNIKGDCHSAPCASRLWLPKSVRNHRNGIATKKKKRKERKTRAGAGCYWWLSALERMLRVRGEGHICGSDFTPPQTVLKQVGLVPHILVSARLKIQLISVVELML